MRRWLILLALGAAVVVLSKLNTVERRRRSSFFRRANRLITLSAWVIVAMWAVTLVWWAVGGR